MTDGDIKRLCVSGAAVLLLAAGCTVGPKYRPPAATQTPVPPVYKESPTQFKETDGWAVARPGDAMLRGKWWEIFKEPELNSLEERLNIDNETIKQAFENFMAARALIREARAQYFPTVTTAPSFNRSLSSGTVGGLSSTNGSAAGLPGHVTTLYSVPLDISWAPDLWGRVRNTVREFQFGAQLSAADLENVRLTAQASLAQFYFEIRGQDALQKVLNETVEADKMALELTQARYQTGVGDALAVVQAQTTLESVQAQAISIGLLRAQFEHAIATLIGRPASSFSIPVRPMTTVPPPIPIGMPSQLLERRPDIAAAERNMAVANAQIGIAYAAFYPTLTLSATGGVQSSTLDKLFSWPSRVWSIGGSVSQTIYDAGLRRATVNQFIATYNSAVAAYRQTVLTAFQQVEDSLSGVRILSQEVVKQKQAVQSAETQLTLQMARYETGIDPYLNVVIAQTTLLGNRQNLVTAQISEMTSAVQLILALGGGWDRSQLPTSEQVSQKPTPSETTIRH